MSLEDVQAAIARAPLGAPSSPEEKAALAECDPEGPKIPHVAVLAMLVHRAEEEANKPSDARARILASIAAAPVEDETEWEREALACVDPSARVSREDILREILSSATEDAAAE